jgi:hypothetical protein
MESSMHRRQTVVTDLESPGSSDPVQSALLHIADRAQTAAMLEWRVIPLGGDVKPL